MRVCELDCLLCINKCIRVHGLETGQEISRVHGLQTGQEISRVHGLETGLETGQETSSKLDRK